MDRQRINNISILSSQTSFTTKVMTVLIKVRPAIEDDQLKRGVAVLPLLRVESLSSPFVGESDVLDELLKNFRKIMQSSE